MKKILNFRPLFYCFIAFGGAILFSPYVFKTNWIYISIFIFIIFGLLILSIIRKKVKIYLVILAFITIGLTSYFVEASTYITKNYSQENAITGRVLSNKQGELYPSIVLDTVSINDKKINENLYIYVYGTPHLNAGENISFSAKLKNISAFYEDDSFNSFYYKNNIRYTANVSGSDIQIIGSAKL